MYGSMLYKNWPSTIQDKWGTLAQPDHGAGRTPNSHECCCVIYSDTACNINTPLIMIVGSWLAVFLTVLQLDSI